MRTEHCTAEHLNALVDGRLEASQAAEVRLHLEQCGACLRSLRILEGVDASLRTLPLHRAPDRFSEKVLSDLQLVPRSSWLIRLLGNAGYVFGALLALGAMAAAFVLTGVLDTEQIRQQGSAAGTAAFKIGVEISGWIEAFSGFLLKYVPFLFTSSSTGTIAMIVVALVVLAGFDRLLMRHLPHRLQKLREG